MLYTEIEMSTPTTISARNPVCKQCGGSYESPYVLRIFSKAGLSQNLYSKLYKISGIKISEDDTRSTVLIRSSVIFIDNMDQFIRRAQSVDNTPSDLNSEYSVKRCVQLNFHRLRISRRSIYQRICHPKASMWMSRNKGGGKRGGRPTRLLPHAKMLPVPISLFCLLGRLCSGRFYIFTEQM